MKKQSVNKIKLGIFVTVGILLFLGGVYFIGETKKLFSNTFHISAMFKDVKGLQVGNNVRFAGITVGTIEDIEIITDTTVKVEMIIDTETQKFIKKDSKAVIGSDGLMGNKILIITPGTNGNPPVKDNAMIGTTAPFNVDDILEKLEKTASNAAVITDDFAVIMGNIRSGRGTIGKLFMDTVFAENLDKSIVNIKQGTSGFKENMDAAKKSFLLRSFLKKKEPEKTEEEKKDEKDKKRRRRKD